MAEHTIDEGIRYAKKGQMEDLTRWLDAGNNPNTYDADGWTPLLWASARGQDKIVSLLLRYDADTKLGHRESEALPIHLAGHSGDVATADVLLQAHPDELDAVWDLNGHGILLQAAFYGHLELAKYLVEKGADTSITTARGLGPMEMAKQFQNHEMMAIIKPYDTSQEEKAAYYEQYLERIAPQVDASEKEQQELTDELVAAIELGLKRAIQTPEADNDTLNRVKALIEEKKVDVNRLGGPLSQPPLVVTVTGNNGLPEVQKAKDLRLAIAKHLLEFGANPSLHENHPMGAQTIIRGAVFNHLDILRECAKHMAPQALTDAINEYPVVNGLTALHDTVLRATMAEADKFEGYLEQATWFMENGGKSDIEDFAGVTQKDIARNCSNPTYRERLLEIL